MEIDLSGMQFTEQEKNTFNKKPKHIELPEYDDNDDEIPCCCKFVNCCGEFCGAFRTWCPLCCCVDYPYKTVHQGNQGIYERFGKYVRTVKPGLHYINPCTEQLMMISKKIQVLDLPPQSIITKDNVSISIDASVYFRIVTSRYAYYRIQNITHAISQITFAILKNTCGQFILQDILEKRQEISDDIEQQVEKFTEEWGAKVEDIYIKDIRLSQELQNALSSAAKQRRLAQSKIISAQADVQSAKLMKEAADELNSKAAMQIRYLETLKQTGRMGNKVIFISQDKDKERIQHLITQGMIQ